jgi:hypothetical protein
MGLRQWSFGEKPRVAIMVSTLSRSCRKAKLKKLALLAGAKKRMVPASSGSSRVGTHTFVLSEVCETNNILYECSAKRQRTYKPVLEPLHFVRSLGAKCDQHWIAFNVDHSAALIAKLPMLVKTVKKMKHVPFLAPTAVASPDGGDYIMVDTEFSFPYCHDVCYTCLPVFCRF